MKALFSNNGASSELKHAARPPESRMHYDTLGDDTHERGQIPLDYNPFLPLASNNEDSDDNHN
jgi:hypothetical protein